ncbi:hypothetical protein MB02_01165 [Croceicoccus estronivorus]|uniref:hypothetical protein n=1 Tax=Croceicoccus estronivorus TaxID=1172626 RepID=UPI0008315A1B|nr:hypothetical protein [Croceicoccus estronivorus]OCC25312.1 hypothetical protein MB02_01165 [Croceicoccus estronivorus]
MTTKSRTRAKADADTKADADFYRVELSGRFPRRGMTYLPGRPLRVSAAIYRDMTEAGVVAHARPD